MPSGAMGLVQLRSLLPRRLLQLCCLLFAQLDPDAEAYVTAEQNSGPKEANNKSNHHPPTRSHGAPQVRRDYVSLCLGVRE